MQPNHNEIIKLVKVKFVSDIENTIVLAIQIVPCLSNKDYIKRVITFYTDEAFMVTEREADWMLNIQKEYRFAQVFED